MKRSLIWTAAGAAILGIGVPAYAAVQTSKPQPSISTVTTVEDVRGNCDEAEHTNDPGCGTVAVTDDTTDDTTAATTASTPTTEASQRGDDDATDDSVDDNDDDATETSVEDDDDATETSNSVEDVSGPCDEAEHADDPRCAAGTAPTGTVEDSSNPGADDSGHHNGGDDSSNSGRGGSDDSGHGGGED